MSTALKCPNPSCPYLFDPSTVPPGVVLACPRCGMRFTLGPPAAPPPAPPPTPPAAVGDSPTVTFPGTAGLPTVPPGYPPPGYAPPPGYPPPGFPAPPPGPAGNPVEGAFGEMTPETAKADNQAGPRLPARESRFQTPLLLLVVAIAVTAAGIAVWYKMTHKPEPPNSDTVSRFKDVNMGFEPPPAPWERDSDTQATTLGPPFMLAYKRDNPEAYMAFGARDYKNREPRPGELRAELTKALDKLLEREGRKEFPEDVDPYWLGQEVRGFKFDGIQKGGGGTVEGEAVAVSYKGVGYWFVAWTAKEMYPEMKSAFADGRGRCKLLDARKDWKAKQSNVNEYKNTDVGYVISDPDGTWKEVEDEARKKDEGADKLLTLSIPVRGRRDQHKLGTLAVYVLPGGGDPLTEARAFVTGRRSSQLKAANADLTVEYQDRTDPPAEQPANTVEKSSEVVRFKSAVKGAIGQNRLHVVSAAKAGDKVVVAHAWCDWAERDDFEGVFMQVTGSLKAER